MLPGFVGGLGEPEVIRASEILARSVYPAGSKQLLGTDHAQRLTELVPDEILPTVAASQR